MQQEFKKKVGTTKTKNIKKKLDKKLLLVRGSRFKINTFVKTNNFFKGFWLQKWLF